MLEKIGYMFDENDNDRVGFLQVRLAAPKPKKTPAREPPKPKDNEKNLSYNACPPDIQAKLRQCRAKEWRKWKESSSDVVSMQMEAAMETALIEVASHYVNVIQALK